MNSSHNPHSLHPADHSCIRVSLSSTFHLNHAIYNGCAIVPPNQSCSFPLPNWNAELDISAQSHSNVMGICHRSCGTNGCCKADMSTGKELLVANVLQSLNPARPIPSAT